MRPSWLSCIQRSLSIEDTIETQLAVLYAVEPLYREHHQDPAVCPVWSGVSSSEVDCTQFIVVGTADSVLIRELSLIQSVLYREIPL